MSKKKHCCERIGSSGLGVSQPELIISLGGTLTLQRTFTRGGNRAAFRGRLAPSVFRRRRRHGRIGGQLPFFVQASRPITPIFNIIICYIWNFVGRNWRGGLKFRSGRHPIYPSYPLHGFIHRHIHPPVHGCIHPSAHPWTHTQTR